ncbi:MAG: SH3 domain-containing protein [bacterium]|nr:SH3 domain-containing protein [bacterium]
MLNRRSYSLLAVMLIAAFGIVTPSPAAAQNSAPYQVFAYLENRVNGALQGTVLVIEPAGITQAIPIPPALFPAPDALVSEIALSPDLRLIALWAMNPATFTAYPAQIADLDAQTCCVGIPTGLNTPIAYDFAGFDPSSRSFAMAAVDDQYEGRLIVFDTASGGTGDAFPPIAILGEEALWARMDSWQADGIRLHPNCYACEGVIEGEWRIWNPRTGAVTAASGEYFVDFGAVLPATGEALTFAQHPAYPFNPEEGMFPRPNAVLYTASGAPPSVFNDPAANAAYPAAFFSAANLDLSDDAESITWVNDGAAFLVSDNSAMWTLVNRDGGQQAIPVAPGSRVLAGTPDGWIAVGEAGAESVEIVKATNTPGGITFQSLGVLNGTIRLISAPALGTSLGDAPAPFAAVPQSGQSAQAPAAPTPMNPTGVYVCEGVAVPPRLTVNGIGRVTPGLPNNIRQQPNTSATVIGRIPGEGVFRVINGPLCSGGFTWWQVDYEGAQGYTVEASGSDYYAEPAS